MNNEVGSSSQNYTNYTKIKEDIVNKISKYNNVFKKASNKNDNPSIAIRNLIRKLPQDNQQHYVERLNAAIAAVSDSSSIVNDHSTAALPAALPAPLPAPLPALLRPNRVEKPLHALPSVQQFAPMNRVCSC